MLHLPPKSPILGDFDWVERFPGWTVRTFVEMGDRTQADSQRGSFASAMGILEKALTHVHYEIGSNSRDNA
ncbi:hypothetical protein IQ268_15065 [Oculatella sp. LEGE 06141]|uniref:hypothetical protein n=1 Tax=Oculatella sp. LEGE 06141 TaxID=1828648 RepID=UPI0018816DB0|nr:hypothetical protein [Oculatella sp. LEGE 06141]MBE9179890.1 hypothetical protein [Oculatella sp. LEGE 06141]